MNSMLKFISTTRTFLQTFSEKLEEFAQMDQGQSDLRELHINKLYCERSNDGLSLKCNYIYHNKFFDRKKTNEFLEDQYNRMKQAIARRYQTHNGYATINKDALEKGYFKDNLAETLFKICSVSSDRTILNKNKKKKQKRVMEKEVVAPTAVPIYVLYNNRKN